jgi:hypothetical protein
MKSSWPTSTDDVDQLMLNAQLRDELEPFRDESVDLVNVHTMTTPMENEFLASMLAWEKAPVLSIGQWFEPELVLPPPDSLDDAQLHQILWDTVHRLYQKRIVLEFTDHLSDRELYCILYRDILPSAEKKIDLHRNYLHWHCLDDREDTDTWLRFYASDMERDDWARITGKELPPSQIPPYRRKMPRRSQA